MSFDTQATVRSLRRYPKERLTRFRSLSTAEQSVVFLELSAYIQQALFGQMTVHEIVDVLDHMDLQGAEKVLPRLTDGRKRAKVVKRLKTDIREKVEYFLRFHPKATLSLIHFNYLFLSQDTTIGEAGDAIDEHYGDTGKFPEILVHEGGVLLGEVPIAVLVRERNSATLKKFVRSVQTVSYQAEISDVINVLTQSERKKVVVLDHDGSVIGIIYADDALSLFGDMPIESLYNFTGVDSSERPFDSVLVKFRHRYKWLIVNLGTAFLAGSVILFFQDTINELTILAVYIPIVAGMGGNAASQTFAVMLRGLTLGAVSFRDGKTVIVREAAAGSLNGLVIGSIVALISVVVNGSPLLGLVVGLTMIAQHTIAATAGATIPLFLKHIGKDPASVSTVFITAVTDVAGISILLGLGTLILI